MLTHSQSKNIVSIIYKEVERVNGVELLDFENAAKKYIEREKLTLPSWFPNELTKNNSGALCQRLIEILNESENQDLRLLTLEVTENVRKNQGHEVISTIAITGSVILFLGLLSKISYSKENGLEIKSGYPDLEKIPEIIKAFNPFSN